MKAMVKFEGSNFPFSKSPKTLSFSLYQVWDCDNKKRKADCLVLKLPLGLPFECPNGVQTIRTTSSSSLNNIFCLTYIVQTVWIKHRFSSNRHNCLGHTVWTIFYFFRLNPNDALFNKPKKNFYSINRMTVDRVDPQTQLLSSQAQDKASIDTHWL